MKFSILSILSLAAAVSAAAIAPRAETDIVKRQDATQDATQDPTQDANQGASVVDVGEASMTDANGNIVAFDANNVNLANTDAGL